jgi:hypothetical protein
VENNFEYGGKKPLISPPGGLGALKAVLALHFLNERTSRCENEMAEWIAKR